MKEEEEEEEGISTFEEYQFKNQIDIKIIKEMINETNEFYIISTIKPSLNLKNQITNLGIQHLKFINFSTFKESNSNSILKKKEFKNEFENEKRKEIWYFEYIQKIENFKKGEKNFLFFFNFIKNFLPFSREIILEEIQLLKMYLNLNLNLQVFFPLTKILKSNLILKILKTIKEIFKNSSNSWLFFIKFGLLDSLTILFQNYLFSLEFEENYFFMFDEDFYQQKKYLKNCEEHYSILIEIIEFFELISQKIEEKNKKISVFHLWV